jgi:hypothetical protein
MNTPQCCKCGKIGQLFVTSDGKAYCDVCFGRMDKARPGKRSKHDRAPSSIASLWAQAGERIGGRPKQIVRPPR